MIGHLSIDWVPFVPWPLIYFTWWPVQWIYIVQLAVFVAVVAAVGWSMGLMLLGAQRIELQLLDTSEQLEKLDALA